MDTFDFRDIDNLPEVAYTTWEIYEEVCRYNEQQEHLNETSS